jgi:hypothetical protein
MQRWPQGRLFVYDTGIGIFRKFFALRHGAMRIAR